MAVRNQKSYSALDVGMSRDGWTTMSPPLEQLLLAIVDGWKRSVGDDEKNTPSDSGSDDRLISVVWPLIGLLYRGIPAAPQRLIHNFWL